MATITTPRTFTVTRPNLMEGDDVARLQCTLTDRFDAWSINKQISPDGCYGPLTQIAVREVCVGLGIDPDTAMKNGVRPELRSKIRNPDKRSDDEVARSMGDAAKHFRADLRKQFADVGGVVIEAGANKPGHPISKTTLDYIARMAHRLGRTIHINCGTNHDQFTANGNVSDHFSGHAVDLGMVVNGGTNDGPVGDRIMIAALMEAGLASADATAKAKAGGLYNINHAGQRVQIIWKTNVGGDHHDHVHVGLKTLV